MFGGYGQTSPTAPHMMQLYSIPSNYTIYGLSWIPSSARLVSVGMTTRGTGPLTIWKLKDRELHREVEHEKSSAMKCVTFGASLNPKRQFATGDHDGRLFVWDVEDLNRPAFAAKAHNGMVNCVDGVAGRCPEQYGAPEILTGGSDGVVNLWDTRRATPVLTVKPDTDSLTVLEGKSTIGSVFGFDNKKASGVVICPECWCVAFGGSYDIANRVIAMGYDTGDLKIVDLRTMKIMWTHHFDNGVVSLEFDRQDTKLNKLVVGTLQGHTYIVDLKTFNEKQGGFAFMDFKPFGVDTGATVWQVKHLPHNRDVWMAAGGGRLALCKYDYPTERSRRTDDGLVGIMGKTSCVFDTPVSSQAIQSFCWSREKNGLCAWGAMDTTINVGFVSNIASLE